MPAESCSQVCQDVAYLHALTSLSQKRENPPADDVRQTVRYHLGDKHAVVYLVGRLGKGAEHTVRTDPRGLLDGGMPVMQHVGCSCAAEDAV